MKQIVKAYSIEQFENIISHFKQNQINKIKVGYIFKALLKINCTEYGLRKNDLLQGIALLIFHIDFENRPLQKFYVKVMDFKSVDFQIKYEFDKFINYIPIQLKELEELHGTKIPLPENVELVSVHSSSDRIWYFALCPPKV